MEVGKKGHAECIVEVSQLASQMKSGDLDVFATPAMVALMEESAVDCLRTFVKEDETSVGVGMNINHISATPQGQKVRSEATIVEISGKKITFEVVASDEKGTIGQGKHERIIVNRERFLKKIQEKF